MDNKKLPEDLSFYQDVTKIALAGLADITKDFQAFYEDFAVKLGPTLEGMSQKELPEASDQLGSIIEATEEATIKIMDTLEDMQHSYENIDNVLRQVLAFKRIGQGRKQLLEGASSSLGRCQDQVVNIFEALSFQDLTGQRIKRVITLVQAIERKVKNVLEALGHKVPKTSPSAPAPLTPDSLVPADDHIDLKGPQRLGDGMDQSAIDALLANL